MTVSTDVRQAAMTLSHVDTHSHIGMELGELGGVSRPFETSAELMTAKCHAVGCRELYGIDPGPYLLADAPEELFRRAAELRAQGTDRALETAFDKANIVHQLAFTGQLRFQDHRPENCRLRELSPRISLLSYIDRLVCGDDFAFCPDGRRDDFCYYEALCEQLGALTRLDAYLDALDREVDSWRSFGVVGVKNGLAYTSGLAYGDPSLEEARAAFARKGDMRPRDVRTVHDFGMHHVLGACKRNNLPVVIHTGFQVWGRASLEQANPLRLHNLLVDDRYRDVTFVLLHGANPYVGEMGYLAGMFANVILDFTWIAWFNRTRFRQALAEWIEVVPHHRFCWGTDTASPEGIVGASYATRQEIADVLEDLVARGVIDETTALAFLENTYLNTPKRVFGLSL